MLVFLLLLQHVLRQKKKKNVIIIYRDFQPVQREYNHVEREYSQTVNVNTLLGKGNYRSTPTTQTTKASMHPITALKTGPPKPGDSLHFQPVQREYNHVQREYSQTVNVNTHLGKGNYHSMKEKSNNLCCCIVVFKLTPTTQTTNSQSF